jgi:hypothetical protein
MATDLHKGIQLDDKFAKAELRLSKALADLETLVEDFENKDHRPVASQVNKIGYASDRIQNLFRTITKLKAKV